MKIDAKIESKESISEKMVSALGFDEPDTIDLVDRKNYADDDSYIDALVKLELERNRPEYIAARSRVVAALKDRAEREEKEQQTAEYKAIRKNTFLTSTEAEQVKERAKELAGRDYRAGKIPVEGLPRVIVEYARALEEKKLNDKARNELLSGLIRNAARQAHL